MTQLPISPQGMEEAQLLLAWSAAIGSGRSIRFEDFRKQQEESNEEAPVLAS